MVVGADEHGRLRDEGYEVGSVNVASGAAVRAAREHIRTCRLRCASDYFGVASGEGVRWRRRVSVVMSAVAQGHATQFS